MLSDITRALSVHDACGALVRRLHARQWDAPNIDVKHGYRNLPKVCGEDFALELGVWEEAWFPTRLVTPGIEVNFWPKVRSLTVNLYAYTNWERDKRWFIGTSHKHRGYNHGLPRFLPFKSRCDCSDMSGAIFEDIAPPAQFLSGAREGASVPRGALHSHRDDWRCPLLVFSDHCGTEYEPIEGGPQILRTEEVLTRAKRWLETRLIPTL